ncbi:MAG: zinc ribbon domain-containing protein [Phycisphaerae bacterium]|nr:zinc ribbon domain-containing protein [Gemmatimonadaceae bacterium]
MRISPELVPLAVGTVLALVALVVVLGPLVSQSDSSDELSPVAPRKVANGDGTAIQALREIEFDRATGKLSDKDYDALRTMYTRDALAEMRASDAADGIAEASTGVGTASADDLVEAAIRRAKSTQQDCENCGTRPPEPDAIYCSSCGHYLPGVCGSCGTRVDVAGARFCVGCGEGLAAA